MGFLSMKGVLQVCIILAGVAATEQYGMGALPSTRRSAERAKRGHKYQSSTCVFAPRKTDEEKQAGLPAQQGQHTFPAGQSAGFFTAGGAAKNLVAVAKPAEKERTAFGKDGVMPADQSAMMQKSDNRAHHPSTRYKTVAVAPH